MASMARSGETLMLRILAVHPDIKVIHNLNKEDEDNSFKAFQFLKRFKPTSISNKHKLIKPYKLEKNQVILIKQGVWKHKYPFKGFVLSRNPVSIYASLKTYDKKVEGYNGSNNYWFENENRLKRWLKEIDPSQINISSSKEPIEQFVDFYNLRMGDLANLNLPIIRYEDLVSNTKDTLVSVCLALDIDMDEKLLKSHEFYERGLEGHGQNDLSKPIDPSSLNKYKNIVTFEEFNFIKENTLSVHNQYGYKFKNGEIIY